ncbi:hypothetical protein GNI_119200 [Gregarina niphandrodes]|uniref:Uncharacterized protein n=1 Tax=Gregarina niphandrodes TaxID=110365 RepID=A0A023B2P2_GRENI|nr:hypothetical protein GNI_119200 [Gregarina niphandrodes]EZG55051.1 hypothetical protein GNI_119200 [Gregarina niphandrodes]|eukprot:XP_011131818.1 hypothetical protein GNI_119200 [Gregarina niphandrodes]
MRCLSAGACVERSVLLVGAVLTCEVGGKRVDMVKALESLKPWDEMSEVMGAGFKLIAQVPDLVVGLPGEVHEELSKAELNALHAAVLFDRRLRAVIIVAGSHCLYALEQVIQAHPDTCGITPELGHAIREWVTAFRNRVGPAYHPYPATDATRVADLKFFLLRLSRVSVRNIKHFNTCTIPILQPCNPDAVLPDVWQRAQAELGSVIEGEVQEVSAVSSDEYKQRMGPLAIAGLAAPKPTTAPVTRHVHFS